MIWWRCWRAGRLGMLALVVVGVLTLVPSQGKAGAATPGFDLSPHPVVYPAKSGAVNVKDFGAKGDGVTDDTQAIQNAITRTHRDYFTPETLYFPSGTYLVSGTLKGNELDTTSGTTHWWPYLTLQGQDQATTIIKLANHAPGFGDANNPQAVIQTASDPCCGSGPDGRGNAAFRNYILDLTVDTGHGNAGAVGIDYLATNEGAVRNVLVRGEGVVGLGMLRPYPGPALVQNVVVDGFTTGIKVTTNVASMTFENIVLLHQSGVGFVNEDNLVSIHNLVSLDAVPAIQNSAFGQVTLLDGALAGGSNSVSAIENSGSLYARNVVTVGYRSAIDNRGTIVPGHVVDLFTSDPPLHLFNNPGTKSLNLPVKNPPAFHEDPANWANVVDYGAKPGDSSTDDTAAIQAALNSGKATVFFPAGQYYVSATLHVGNTVKKILGLQSAILSFGTTTPDPLIRFEGTSNPAILQSFEVTGWIEQATAQALVLRDISDNNYRADAGAGDFFGENLCCGLYRFTTGQHAWVRQFNTEGSDATRIINNGGHLWILGLKTEGISTVIETDNHGETQVLGGLIYPAHGTVPPGTTAFVVNDSTVALTFSTESYIASADFPIFVRETQNGVTLGMPESAAYHRETNESRFVPLYSSYGPGNPVAGAISYKTYLAASGQLANGAYVGTGAEGQFVGGMNFSQASVTIANVDGGVGGTASLTIHYATSDSGSKTLIVNGVTVQQITLPGTGGWGYTGPFGDYGVSITLNPGTSNTIEILNDDRHGDCCGDDLVSFTVAVPSA